MVLVWLKPDLSRPTGFLRFFDTVGLVIWPVKIVPKMTYYVLNGMLNPTHSLTLYHAVTGRAPTYIRDLFQPVAAMLSRHSFLQSATTDTLFIPCSRLLFGERAFPVAAPHNVHSIDSTTTSDNEPKTFLFTKFFMCDFTLVFMVLFHSC